ncbi:sigma-70 family RNA polymerase sigma factor [Terriglobus albidus]|uniref:Sigma-70 family RNA polymerase sigma factor n=1 Tax=Terriglobus albidus TaxID=1592106 RepID=A0A5B9EF69_9BACT|nr:sigma-70 family RNA polymerase sigma factor [Terriglobus albidus]
MNSALKSDSTALPEMSTVRPHIVTRDRRTRLRPSSPMLYLASSRTTTTEPTLEFHAFNAQYIENLRKGDIPTQNHFVAYFSALIHIKLRSRLQSPQAIEDVRQETFARVLAMLGKETPLRRPEALGAFVNSVCNNVLLEHYRSKTRTQSLDEFDRPELPALDTDIVGQLAAGQLKNKVSEILLGMPSKDRMLLKAVFLEEKDRDEVCKEFGVDREYLRVLLFRAKKEFKTEYLKRARFGSYVQRA